VPFDLVHSHLQVVGPAVLAGLCDGPPVLHTLHWDVARNAEFYATFDGGGRVRFVCVSEPQLATAPASLAAQVVRAIPLGVDLDAFAPADEHTADVVMLSRITPVKGTHLAARVCREAGVPLILAGPVAGVASPAELSAALEDPASPLHGYGDVRHYLEAVQPFEDGERIRWIGTVGGADKDRLVGRARAVLMPISWEEPGATAAIEALACGTPVIAMRRGALAEIIDHGRTGFLADDEAQFAEFMPRADEIDPAACRRSVEERFSAGVMADGYLRLYTEVLARTGA
jgi:glycosyltransferase involved in cell wall biosynthesis